MNTSDILLDGFRPPNGESANLKIVIFKYLKYWYLFALALILALALAFFYLRTAVPQYPVAATILINSTNNSSDYSQNAIYSDLESYQTIKTVENEAEILKSISLMNLAMKELDFRVSIYKKVNRFRRGEIFGDGVPLDVEFTSYDSLAYADDEMLVDFDLIQGNSETYQLQDEEGNITKGKYGEEVSMPFGTFIIEKNDFFNPEDELSITFNNPFSLGPRYAGKLDVFIINKLASVLRLSFDDPVPQRGVIILNKLIDVYNREALRSKNSTAVNTLDLLEDQIYTITREIREIEGQVEAYKRENKITELSSDAERYSFNSNLFQNQLSEVMIKLEVLKSIQDYLINQQDEYEAVPSTLNIDDPTLISLVAQYNELQKERERMLRAAQPGSPLVQSLNQQLASVKRNLLENIKNIKSSIEISRDNMMARARELDQQSGRVPEIERQLLEITRAKETKQAHLDYLNQKREEAVLSLAATTVTNSRIIDPAMAGTTPSKPRTILILGFAIFLGLGIPFGFVFAKYKLNDKINDKADITSRTSIPILGEISHSSEKHPIVVGESVRTALAEQFRLIRTNIQFALLKNERNALLVTSSMGGEGKTFFSINIAIAMAITGKKVAVCEFDFRRPALMDYLGLKTKVGLVDYLLEDNLDLNEIAISPDFLPDGLDVFGCGEIPENPAELMLSPQISVLMKKLKETYDIVILDTAPIGQVSDAFPLVRHVDMSIFIMRYKYTPAGMIDFLNDNVKDSKLKNPLIVLNDAKGSSNYGYGYGYGNYHGVSEKIRKKRITASTTV